jgi:RNA polymerase sigma factor (sigma-70 family)
MRYGATSVDTQLIDRFRAGDDAAFDELVQHHKQRIFTLIYRMTGDRDWSEDITVEVFLEAFSSLPRFRQDAKFATWLHRLAVNVCLEQLRLKKAKRQVLETSLGEIQQLESPNPAQAMLQRELADQVLGAMQILPEAHRAAMALFYLEERSCAEIAEILSLPRGTVKSRIYHATRQLRDKLRADGILPVAGGDF